MSDLERLRDIIKWMKRAAPSDVGAIEQAIARIERLEKALRLARRYVVGAQSKSLRFENIVADDTRIVDEALAGSPQ